MNHTWRNLGPYWGSVDFYEAPDVFLRTFADVPEKVGLLYAAHLCDSEICNGGFYQLFWNGTGMLAPEALLGFDALLQLQSRALLQQAMNMLGDVFPRYRAARKSKLNLEKKARLDALDDSYYRNRATEAGGFEVAANRFAAEIS